MTTTTAFAPATNRVRAGAIRVRLVPITARQSTCSGCGGLIRGAGAFALEVDGEAGYCADSCLPQLVGIELVGLLLALEDLVDQVAALPRRRRPAGERMVRDAAAGLLAVAVGRRS